MKKQLIKEATRLQQLAGIIKENFVGLAPINSPLYEDDTEEDDDDTADTPENQPEDDWNAPGKTDEFDTDEPTGPSAKDIASTDVPADEETPIPVTVKVSFLRGGKEDAVKVGSKITYFPKGISDNEVIAAVEKGTLEDLIRKKRMEA